MGEAATNEGDVLLSCCHPTVLVPGRVSAAVPAEAALTVSTAVCVATRVAVITELVLTPTVKVVTVKLACVCPAATVTLAGTVAAEVLEEERVTDAPPAGAAPLKVTVPVEGLPPVTAEGFNDREETDAPAVTVIWAVC